MSDENWVSCDRCSKWRKLPPGVTQDSLPDKWYCEDNKWDPVYSNCSVGAEPYEQDAPKLQPQAKPPPKRSPSPPPPVPFRSPQPSAAVAPPSFIPNPQMGVKDALTDLVHVLEDTQRLIVNLNADSDQALIYQKINTIPLCLAQTTKSMEKEGFAQMQVRIPHPLLDTVERVLNNNPSLFTKDELTRIKALHERVNMSAKRFKKLHDEL